ncbi:hypothetical protein FACS189413_03340 [Bacteroidia bacterium]|nr:hypothetical protein FACS189413_03340 [Bacteroidia bacterium]
MGIGHEDTKEIDALREALVNLLIHTDYFSPMKPRIRVFTNRIEFENPGKLPRTVEELMKTDETLPRNPVLAKFFRLAKLCESAGYGFDKMLQWKKQTGNEVLFETTIDKTKFTFMLDTTKTIGEESGTENNQKTVEKILETVEKTVEKIVETDKKTTRRQPEDNQKTVEKILAAIHNNPNITQKELVDITGLTRRGVEWNILQLKNNDIIRRDGADKGGKWVIIKPD